MKLQQDRTQTELYLSLLDGKDTPYTFQVFDDNKDRADRTMARVIEGTLSEHWKLLTDLNNLGAGIFITVNRGRGGRKRENIKSVRSIFIEDDSKAGVARPDLPIRPSFIVNSSDGNYHHYFKVDDMPLSLFEPTQNRLIADYNSDKAVKDLSRVLRLPGFFHQKAAPYLVNLVDDKSLINPVAYTCDFHHWLIALVVVPNWQRLKMELTQFLMHFQVLACTYQPREARRVFTL